MIRFLSISGLLLIGGSTRNNVVTGLRDDRKQYKRGLMQDKNNFKQEKDTNKNNNMGKAEYFPSSVPSDLPSLFPTESPLPSPSPTSIPTSSPKPSSSADTLSPTIHPPTSTPSVSPSKQPTAAPSEQPTAIPTALPSVRPTALPTFAPTKTPTSTPTLRPSLSQQPSIFDVRGYVPISFSLFNKYSDDTTVSKVLILDAIVNILCADTEFAFYDRDDLICPSQDVAISELGKYSQLRVDQTAVTFEFQAYSNIRFSKWMLLFPVTQIGELFQMEPEDALRLVQVEAQASITRKIQDGTMDSMLNETFAVVGLEKATWSLDTNQNSINPILSLEESPRWIPLELRKMPPLRIIGIVMFLLTSFVAWMIVHYATKSRMQREWDAEFKDRGKGGLVTEEGVDYMLDMGRHESHRLKTTPSAPDMDMEDTLKLPLPGYMNVELFGGDVHSYEEQQRPGSQFTSSQIST